MLRKGDKNVNEATGIRTRRGSRVGPGGLARSTAFGPLGWRYVDDPFGWVEAFDRQFEEMRRDMESLIFPTGSLLEGPGRGVGWPLGAEAALAARLDLKDNGKEYIVSAELPGFGKEEVDVQVTGEGLTLSASRSESTEEGSEASGYLARERSYRSLRRAVAFPEEVDADAASAQLQDGVLTLTVPKQRPTEEPMPRKVKVE
ncbi:MAG TPA: Hsp20/alpha crystallin family protein [Candidatus Thermoplasmatota archaeon]